MDPVSLIIAALTAGAGELGKEAVKDSYNGLKQLILNRFKKQKNNAGEKTVQKIEIEPENPEQWKQVLQQALLEIQADEDDTIIRTASELISLLSSSQAVHGFDFKNNSIENITIHIHFP